MVNGLTAQHGRDVVCCRFVIVEEDKKSDKIMVMVTNALHLGVPG